MHASGFHAHKDCISWAVLPRLKKKLLLGISFRVEPLSGTGGEHELTWLLKLFLLKNFIRL